MTETNHFREIENNAAFSRVGVKVVTHPKKPGRYAKILIAYPRDGAGRLTVYIVDGFGDQFTTQKGQAGDGHVLVDHCATDAQSAKLLAAYGKAEKSGDAEKIKAVLAKAGKSGYRFTNWTSGGNYQSCYKLPGLDYLQALGYQIFDIL